MRRGRWSRVFALATALGWAVPLHAWTECFAMQVELHQRGHMLSPQELAAANAKIMACREREQAVREREATTLVPILLAGRRNFYSGEASFGAERTPVRMTLHQPADGSPLTGWIEVGQGARQSVTGGRISGICRLQFGDGGLLQSFEGDCEEPYFVGSVTAGDGRNGRMRAHLRHVPK